MTSSIVDNETNQNSLETIRQQIRQIVDNTIRPNAERLDQNKEFPDDNLQALAAYGFNSVLLPKSLYGLGLENVYTAFSTIVQEIARGCPSTALVYTMHVGATNIILKHGNKDQQERWLKRSVSDGKIGTISRSEKATGGHYWNNLSKATRFGNGYLINAEKSFTTSAGYADFYVLQTGSPEAEDPADVTYFIVDAHQEGIVAGEWDVLGVKANHSSSLTFKDVFVHERDRITEEGKNVQNGPLYLLGLGAAWTGTAIGILDEVTNFAINKIHKDVNKKLTDYQIIRSQLAQANILIDSLKAWQNQLVFQLDSDEDVSEELGNTILEFKVHASEIANQVAQIAMDVAGGYGYKKGTLERLYRDARAGIAMGPSNNLARDMIGKRIVGME